MKIKLLLLSLSIFGYAFAEYEAKIDINKLIKENCYNRLKNKLSSIIFILLDKPSPLRCELAEAKKLIEELNSGNFNSPSEKIQKVGLLLHALAEGIRFSNDDLQLADTGRLINRDTQQETLKSIIDNTHIRTPFNIDDEAYKNYLKVLLNHALCGNFDHNPEDLPLIKKMEKLLLSQENHLQEEHLNALCDDLIMIINLFMYHYPKITREVPNLR